MQDRDGGIVYRFLSLAIYYLAIYPLDACSAGTARLCMYLYDK